MSSKIKVYSTKTKVVKEASLPKDLKGELNPVLLAQALHVYRAKTHGGRAKTKTRSEIARTTKKWFKQKGTGRARHGARSAPIFVGGSKAHGPMGLRRQLGLPAKMRKKALESAIAAKMKTGAIVGADLGGIKKTKDAAALLATVGEAKRYLVVLSEKNKNMARSFRNIGNVRLVMKKDMNAYDVYFGGRIVFDSETL